MNDRNNVRSFVLSLIATLAAFAIINGLAYSWRTPPCCDWTYTTGIPFRFLEEGGFAGIRRLMWGGVAADVGSLFVIAFLADDFRIFPGDATPEDIYGGRVPAAKLKGGTAAELAHKIRTGFLLHGVDVIGWPGGLVSAAHTGEDVARTVEAFERTLDPLAAKGEW